MFNRAPVAFLCTLISFDFASRVNGTKAPDLAILVLFSSAITKYRVSAHARQTRFFSGLTVSGQVGDTTDSVALDLDVG